MEQTKAWEQYQQGIKYKHGIRLQSQVSKNEKFYSGRHWEGVKAEGLPKPILNSIERICNFKIESILSEPTTMRYTADGVATNSEFETDVEKRKVAELLSDYSKTTWERLKMDSLNADGMLNAVLSGDMITYFWWDERINAGNGVMGDINADLIDNVNYFPGDPNNPIINDAIGPVQPYIMLAFRRMVSDVKKEALKNGVPQEDVDRITGDSETENQAGDRGKQELEGDDGKTIVLLKMWPEEQPIPSMQKAHIMAEKSTKAVVIRPKWDTGLTRYPVALMNWKQRKNSAHGEAEVTGMINNQLAMNKKAAMDILWSMLHGYPKPLYDSTRISSWTNDIGVAIPVNGEVSGAAQYMTPAQMSSASEGFLDKFIGLVKDMHGANETALGDTSITKTAAGIVALQKAAAVPLNGQKRRFYQYIEDIGRIWLDFWVNKYTVERNLTITKKNEVMTESFNGANYQDMTFGLKIDVGPSTQWSEAASITTLDNLLMNDRITDIEYFERVPDGIIPDRQELIESRQNQMEQQSLTYELMARFIESLPPDQQAQLEQVRMSNPEQYEAMVKQMISQPQMGGMAV